MNPQTPLLGRIVLVTLNKEFNEQISHAGGTYSIGEKVPGMIVRTQPGNHCNIQLFFGGGQNVTIENVPFNGAGVQGTWNYVAGTEAVAA
jgi:hypothetical protein